MLQKSAAGMHVYSEIKRIRTGKMSDKSLHEKKK